MDNEALERITILLQARDRDLQRAIEKNSREVRRFAQTAARDTKQMATEIDRHTAQVGASVMDMGKSFAVGLGAGVIGAAFAGVSTNLAGIVRGIAEVGDQAKRSGLGAQAFQEWKYVAEANRIPVDALVDGFKELALRSDEFIQTGAGPAAESMNRLGYSAAELTEKLKDPSALMLEIIGRLDGMDKAAQIRIADELFGGTGGERFVELLSQGEEGIRSFIDRAHEVGAVLDEQMIAKAAELDQAYTDLATRIGAAFKSIAVEVASGISEGPASIQALSDAFDEIFSKSGTVSDQAEALTGIQGVSEALQGQGEAVREMLPDLTELREVQAQLGSDAGEVAAKLTDVVTQLDDMGVAPDVAGDLDKIIERLTALDFQAATGQIEAAELRLQLSQVGSEAEASLLSIQGINGIDLSGAVGAVGALIGVLGRAAAAAANVRANLPGAMSAAQGSPGNDKHPPIIKNPNAMESSPKPKAAPLDVDFGYSIPKATGGGSGGGGGGGADPWAAAVKGIQERTAALQLEAAAFLEVVGSQQKYGDAAEYARQKAKLLAEAQEAGKEITPELRAEIDQLALAYMNASIAADDAGNKLDDMRDRAKRGADAITDIFMAMTEGGDSAKRAISSLLLEMAKVAAQRAFLSMANLGGGGGLFGLIGAALGGARAGGGAVRSGVPYLVNENTPNSEVFVPSISGAILNVPQAQAALRGAMGGSVQRLGVTIGFDASAGSFTAFVKDQAGRVVAQATPGIVQQSVGATYQAAREVPIG